MSYFISAAITVAAFIALASVAVILAIAWTHYPQGILRRKNRRR